MQAGKTATVYALAKELGYQILEVGPSLKDCEIVQLYLNLFFKAA